MWDFFCIFAPSYYSLRIRKIGRFWRWHINFCPGWKAYFTSRPDEEQKQLREKYNFTKYQGI